MTVGDHPNVRVYRDGRRWVVVNTNLLGMWVRWGSYRSRRRAERVARKRMGYYDDTARRYAERQRADREIRSRIEQP